MITKKVERRNTFNTIWGTFWSRNRSPWLYSKQKPDRCEPQDTLRCSKAVPEVRGGISWLPGAPELEPVAHKRLFWARNGSPWLRLIWISVQMNPTGAPRPLEPLPEPKTAIFEPKSRFRGLSVGNRFEVDNLWSYPEIPPHQRCGDSD